MFMADDDDLSYEVMEIDRTPINIYKRYLDRVKELGL